ncbi:ribosome silencing factor [Calditerrivibrio nitroreducens]|uniref:Ribosomal silencing factor RsfS n=1 Tax=Calditerrivibrio nitroreducens (strain DSM 19672 / NBRC 101217 / Yu37-1) TaxID=768670 RepID=E4TJ98_CALNY|nr:ribosome silencing factor [Calditerrivibrio nitroreducens]ADR19165.1 iojap-like protein [Calditerrivibrio nitroreducens DSM 19672]
MIEEVLRKIKEKLLEKMAENVVIYKIKEVSSIADYLIICTGNSDTHIKSLADYAEEVCKEQNLTKLKDEGYGISRWVCIDFGSILIHIMGKQEREYYKLESIWGACDKVEV